MALSSASDNVPVAPTLTREELVTPFVKAEKPATEWRIGAEAEKFGVEAATGAPLQYDGPHGVLRVLDALVERHGWVAQAEVPGGPLIALRRENASVTLEPGGQVELSGAPQPNIHKICAEMHGHLHELREISSEMNLQWLSLGFHPLARQEELPWVPKRRYGIMKRYLPTQGDGALDMMRRTATVQANFDYSDAEDALVKLRVCLQAAPLVNAMTANSPFKEGQLSDWRSTRGEVWTRMDPSRSGLIPKLWTQDTLSYEDYIEWALDAGMFLFRRGEQVIANTGQSFRSFLNDGYQGHHATLEDWVLHLSTLFPEARLKSTLEVRCCDALPAELTCSVPALFTGLLYDAKALAQATTFFSSFSYEQVAEARDNLVRAGLRATIAGKPARELAEQLLEIAEGGLERRARLNAKQQDERLHLSRIKALVATGECPADRLVDGLEPGDSDLEREILARARI